MERRRGIPGALGLSVAVATIVAGGAVGAAQQAPALPPEKPAPVLGVPPTAEDVEAWRRLWSGGTTTAAPPVAAPPVPPVPPPPPTTASAATLLDEVYTAYAAGEPEVLTRRLGNRAAYEDVRPVLASTLQRWQSEWSPVRAVFTFDLALTAFAARWPNPGQVLLAARDLVAHRPDTPGSRPDDDRFEVLFHSAAVALLAALNVPRDVERYLDGIADRIAADHAAQAGGRLIAPRLLLAKAAAREVQTLPTFLAVGERDRRVRRTWVARTNDGDARRALRDVVALADAAAAFPETRTEALVRRAFLLHRLGQDQQAADTLNVLEPSEDPIVDNWRLLVLGRVRAALGEVQAAAAAYEEAAERAPGAQTPAVALAALHLKAGDRNQAVHWAERARTTLPDELDPWPAYWTGNSRFLTAWIAELRSERQ